MLSLRKQMHGVSLHTVEWLYLAVHLCLIHKLHSHSVSVGLATKCVLLAIDQTTLWSLSFIFCVAPLPHFFINCLLASDSITGFMYIAIFRRIMLVRRHVCVCGLFLLLFQAFVLHIYTTMYPLLVDNIRGGVLRRLRWSDKRAFTIPSTHPPTL